MLSVAHKYVNLIHTQFACADKTLGICFTSFSAYLNSTCVVLILKDISVLTHGRLDHLTFLFPNETSDS